MKVIKRDGRIVDYDKSKIKIAVEKANKEVVEKEKATNQDIIEAKLMELGKYELAKKYIVYRYTRALVRKSNTTDKTILGLIRNSNKGVIEDGTSKSEMIAATQRDLIAGEVSKTYLKEFCFQKK